MYWEWRAVKKVVSVTNARRKFCQVIDYEIVSVWEEAVGSSKTERQGG